MLFSFQEIQHSDLEHSAVRHLTFDIQYLVTTMSEECLIWSTNNRVCQEKRGKSLGEKAKKSLVKAAEMRKDDLITAA